jgi:hypothetical protein
VGAALRARLYDPVARSEGVAFLRALVPLAGPASLNAVGIPADARPVGKSTPRLADRVTRACRVTQASGVEAMIVPSLGMQVTLLAGPSNRLLIGPGALSELEPGAFLFLLVRACELCRLGYPRLAAFGSGALDQVLSEARARVSCAAVDGIGEPATVRPELRGGAQRRNEVEGCPSTPPAILAALDRASAQELEGLATLSAEVDGKGILMALERSASRVSLLAIGHAGAALFGALRLAPEVAGAHPSAVDPAQAFARSPFLADLLLTSLADDIGALRKGLRSSEEPPA